MEGIFLLICCIALFIVQIVLLVKSIKNKDKKKFLITLCVDFIPIFVLCLLFCYYEYLAPRGGFMPGLAYLGEELTSFGAIVVYGIMGIITIIAGFFSLRKKKNK